MEPKHYLYYYWKLEWRYRATTDFLTVNCRLGQTNPTQLPAALDNQPDFNIQEPPSERHSTWQSLEEQASLRTPSEPALSRWKWSRTGHVRFLPSLKSTNKMNSFLLSGGGANEEGGYRITEVLRRNASSEKLQDQDVRIPPHKSPKPYFW